MINRKSTSEFHDTGDEIVATQVLPESMGVV